MNTTLIAGAVIQRDGEVLLVQQQGPDDPTPSWAIPGGRAHQGELLNDALVREVYEETGLQVESIGGVVYTGHLVFVEHAIQTVVMVLAVNAWTGHLKPDDPDDFILDAQFVPLAAAARAIEESQPYQPMREPIVAYLRGEVPQGTVWVYHAEKAIDVQLVGRFS